MMLRIFVIVIAFKESVLELSSSSRERKRAGALGFSMPIPQCRTVTDPTDYAHAEISIKAMKQH